MGCLMGNNLIYGMDPAILIKISQILTLYGKYQDLKKLFLGYPVFFLNYIHSYPGLCSVSEPDNVQLSTNFYFTDKMLVVTS